MIFFKPLWVYAQCYDCKTPLASLLRLLSCKIYPNQAEDRIDGEIQYPAPHKSLAGLIQLPRIHVNLGLIIVVRKYLILVLFIFFFKSGIT